MQTSGVGAAVVLHNGGAMLQEPASVLRLPDVGASGSALMLEGQKSVWGLAGGKDRYLL
jgi:hypothetical protein